MGHDLTLQKGTPSVLSTPSVLPALGADLLVHGPHFPRRLVLCPVGLFGKCSCSLEWSCREDTGALPFALWGAAAGLVMEMRGAGSVAVPQCVVFS